MGEWYDYYLKARDRLIPAGKCAEALKELQAAVLLKPDSGLNAGHLRPPVRGLPALLLAGGVPPQDGRQRERHPPLQPGGGPAGHPEEPPLQGHDRAAHRGRQRRAEPHGAPGPGRARPAAGRGQGAAPRPEDEEALTRLAQAEPLAKALDPATQRTVAEARERIRADAQEQADAAARDKRLEQTLQEGARLLEEGKPTEAVVRFDEALAVDPRNARALEGKRGAQERILATTTREALGPSFREGKALFEAGEYERALAPLTDAAADPGNAAARELLAQARRIVEGTRRQKELQSRIDELLAKGERQLAAGKYPEAQVELRGRAAPGPGQRPGAGAPGVGRAPDGRCHLRALAARTRAPVPEPAGAAAGRAGSP